MAGVAQEVETHPQELPQLAGQPTRVAVAVAVLTTQAVIVVQAALES